MLKLNFKILFAAFAVVLSLMCNVEVKAADLTNVTLNKPVSLQGTFFQDGWGNHTTANPQTLVDGNFLPRSRQWDNGTVWWDSDSNGGGQYIQINLQGVYNIIHSIIQSDDNDAYTLLYRDLNSGNWLKALDIQNFDSFGWGMQTRPNPNNNNQMAILPSAFITDAVRFTHLAQEDSGDTCYSVSEIQLYGTPVPEPSSIILGLISLGGLFGLKRKK